VGKTINFIGLFKRISKCSCNCQKAAKIWNVLLHATRLFYPVTILL